VLVWRSYPTTPDHCPTLPEQRHIRIYFCLIAVIALAQVPPVAEADQWRSHPVVRRLPPLSNRPLAEGPTYFVDANNGDDDGPGSQKHPWATVNHALEQLEAGDTLVLRHGNYFENVYCAVRGTTEKPITIRSYPGERVVVDGGIPEFQTSSTQAWESSGAGAKDEYVSTRTYRNIRDVVGMFGDSNIGLQTYWHSDDLRATNEMWIVDKTTRAIYPVYCGPQHFGGSDPVCGFQVCIQVPYAMSVQSDESDGWKGPGALGKVAVCANVQRAR
jgi:hypothetical protein